MVAAAALERGDGVEVADVEVADVEVEAATAPAAFDDRQRRFAECGDGAGVLEVARFPLWSWFRIPDSELDLPPARAWEHWREKSMAGRKRRANEVWKRGGNA